MEHISSATFMCLAFPFGDQVSLQLWGNVQQAWTHFSWDNNILNIYAWHFDISLLYRPCGPWGLLADTQHLCNHMGIFNLPQYILHVANQNQKLWLNTPQQPSARVRQKATMSPFFQNYYSILNLVEFLITWYILRLSPIKVVQGITTITCKESALRNFLHFFSYSN